MALIVASGKGAELCRILHQLKWDSNPLCISFAISSYLSYAVEIPAVGIDMKARSVAHQTSC